jgi:hypothetical protein
VQEKIDEMRREKLRSRNRHRTPLE